MMKRNVRHGRGSFPAKTLAAAIAGALVLAATGTAYAEPEPIQGTTVFTLTGPSNLVTPGVWSQAGNATNYLHTGGGWQYLSQSVTADLDSAGSLVNGIVSGAPVTQTNQVVTAGTLDQATKLTGANAMSNTVDLGLLGSDGTNEGLGILSGQLSTGGGAQATVSGGYVSTSVEDYTSGSITQTGNSISAAAGINNAVNQVSGTVPAGFVGTAAGSVSSTTNPTAATAANVAVGGTVTITNAQAAIDANAVRSSGRNTTSYAHVTGSTISVADVAPDEAVAANVALSDNTIAASYGSNQASNGFDATSGSAFSGTVALSNTQSNVDGTGGRLGRNMVQVRGSEIGSDVLGDLGGALTQSDNTVSAGVQGNAASNQIVFAQGVDVLGSAVNGKLSSNSNANGTHTVTATGDLVLASTQANSGTRFDSRVDDSDISSTVWSLAANGTVTLDGNALTSSSTGNTVANGVTANAGTYTANTIVANQQTNDATSVAARIRDSGVGTNVYDDEGSIAGNVTLTNSTVQAAATGNQAQSQVDVSATNLAVYSNTDQAYARPTNAWTDKAGIGVSNLQSNTGGTTLASVWDSGVEAYQEGLVAGAVTVQGNAVSANAAGNDATTGISVSGSNGNSGGQLANSQSNANATLAIAGDSSISTEVDGIAGNATLATSGNTVSTNATGNHATNTMAASFDNLTTGLNTDSWTVPSNVIDASKQYNTTESPFAIASNQYNNATTQAITRNSEIGTEVGSVTGGAISLDGNAVAATAIGNSVSNTLGLAAGNLASASGKQDQVASIGNLQESQNGGATASVGVSGSDPRKVGQIGDFIDGSADGTSLTVNDNAVQAAAYSNAASNTLTLAGGTYDPQALANPGVNIGYTAADSLNVSAALALQNVQVGSGMTPHGAEIVNGNVGVNLIGGASDDRQTLTSSTLSVDGNQVIADTRDNYATNELGIGVSYAADGTATANPMSVLDTTAALQNAQSSASYLGSSVSGLVGVIAGHYDVDQSNLDISGNSIQSTAIANTGLNRLDVAATQLGGDSANSVHLPAPGVADYSSVPDPDLNIGVGIGADYALSNVQQSTSTVSSSLAGTGAGLGLGEGSVNGGSLTVNGNSQGALAVQNSASNTLNLLGTNLAASAGLANVQSAFGLATLATVTTDASSGLGAAVQIFGSLGSTTALPVTIGNNTITAQAEGNDASNVVHGSADGTIGGQMFGLATTGNNQGLQPQAFGDYALYSDQQTSGTIGASVSPGLTGVEVVGMDANGVSSTIGNANGNTALTVSGNQLAAQATANNVSNSVTLDGAPVIGASASLTSIQNASGQVSASMDSASVGIYNRDVGQPQGGAVTNSTLTVSDNQLAASASGNNATNTLTVQPTALNAAEVVNTQAMNAGGTNTAIAGYAVLNAQNNASAVSASVTNSTIGVNPDVGNLSARGSLASLQSSPTTVSGNSAIASAAGNTASSSIAMAALPGSMPSASLVSNQVNSAAISATVSNVQVGVEAGMGVTRSNSPITVSGNTIAASAIGNSATNHIGVGH